MVNLLIRPEERYETAGERFRDEGSYIDASEQFAYALALRLRKGEEISAARTRFEEVLKLDPENREALRALVEISDLATD